MRRYPRLLVACLLSGCVGDVDFGDARFACASNAQCGRGASCIDGVCAAPDTSPPPPPGFDCTASVSATSAGGAASFHVLVREDGKRFIVVEYQGLHDEVELPEDVLLEDDKGPLEACCENPCCQRSSR